MKYIEVLEKHGIAVNNKEIRDKFITNIQNDIRTYHQTYISYKNAFIICQEIGISFDWGTSCDEDLERFLLNILFPIYSMSSAKERRPVEFNEFLLRLSMLLKNEYFISNDNLKICVENALLRWKLPYIVCDGIIIPKGVEEFDKALIIDVMDWLKSYPTAYKTYTVALQQYYNDDEPRDIADNLRKAFEAFLQEFLGNTRNLDNNIGEVGKYLKDKNINEEIRNMFTTLITHYKLLNDKTAKHHNYTDKNSIEFLLYQTGVFMRYLLIIQQS